MVGKNIAGVKSPNLGTLFTYLGVYTGIWIALFQLMLYLIDKQIDVLSLSMAYLIWIVFFFTFIVFKQVFLTARAIANLTIYPQWGELNQNKVSQKIKKAYASSMFGLFEVITSFIFVFLIITYSSTLGIIVGTLISVLGFLILFTLWFFTRVHPMLKKGYLRLKLRSLFFAKPSWSGVGMAVLNLSLNFLLLFLYTITVSVFVSGVNFHLDQEMYSMNETVIVKVQSYGLIPPKIEKIYYSNEDILLYDGKDKPYPASAKIVQLTPDILINETYNSHIAVIGNFFKIGNYSLSEPYIKRIPVYYPSSMSKSKVQANE